MLEIGSGLAEVLVAFITGVFGFLSAKLLHSKGDSDKKADSEAGDKLAAVVEIFTAQMEELREKLTDLEVRATTLQQDLEAEQALREEVCAKYEFALDGLRSYRSRAPEVDVTLNIAVERDL